MCFMCECVGTTECEVMCVLSLRERKRQENWRTKCRLLRKRSAVGVQEKRSGGMRAEKKRSIRERVREQTKGRIVVMDSKKNELGT